MELPEGAINFRWQNEDGGVQAGRHPRIELASGFRKQHSVTLI